MNNPLSNKIILGLKVGRLTASGARGRYYNDRDIERRDSWLASGHSFDRNHKATFTSAIRIGISTRGPITVAKATDDPNPKAAMATAMASSKLLLAL